MRASIVLLMVTDAEGVREEKDAAATDAKNQERRNHARQWTRIMRLGRPISTRLMPLAAL